MAVVNSINVFINLLQLSVGISNHFEKIPSEEEWYKVFEISNEQSLVGVIFFAIEKLPDNQKPPRLLLLEWIGLQNMIISRNHLLNKRATEVSTIIKGLGYDSCVLKGQSVASYYIRPVLRTPGDIDLWVDAPEKELISMLQRRYCVSNISYHHADVNFFNDVEVEIHYKASWLCNPFLNKKLQTFFNEQKTFQMQNHSGLGFNNPTTLFNSIHLLVHIYRHLFMEGIGLRQVMDYYYVITSLTEDENKEMLKVVADLKMSSFLYSILYVLHIVFAMPEQKMPCSMDEEKGKFLLHEILTGGNFGRYDKRNYHEECEGKIKRYIRTTKRLNRFIRYYPQEALWVPVWRIWHDTGRTLHLWN